MKASGLCGNATAGLFILGALLSPLAVGSDMVTDKRVQLVRDPWVTPVPKAHCGRYDWTETGLQGQTSMNERISGLSELGFNCNLDLVSQFQGEGASYGLAWYKHCAYYGTANTPQQAHPGVVVIDASNPKRPRATGYLDARAMLEPWESLKVNKARKMLGATKGPGGPLDTTFAFYDISDCAHPKLLSDFNVPGHSGHAGQFAPDGMTYYGTSLQNPGHLTAVDISDPTNPKVLLALRPTTFEFHDISFSEDGTRLYGAQFPGNGLPNGLTIMDVSDIQYRRPNPQVRVISSTLWQDGYNAQVALKVTYQGRPHLIFTDERGAYGSGIANKLRACSEGLPPHGFARIIDISNERNPKLVSKLMLEVSDPANCSQVLGDPDLYSYSSHYCGVDAIRNPSILACSWREGGLRVFDIHDPYLPREIAYYKAPARRTQFLPGSIFWQGTNGGDRTGDQTPSSVRFRSYKGETHLWFTTQDNGFQIVRFTNDLVKSLPVLKSDEDDD